MLIQSLLTTERAVAVVAAIHRGVSGGAEMLIQSLWTTWKTHAYGAQAGQAMCVQLISRAFARHAVPPILFSQEERAV